MSKPAFPGFEGLHADIVGASGRSPLPQPKGAHLWVDGLFHAVSGLDAPIRGEVGYAWRVNQRELENICGLVDVRALGFKGLRATDLAPLARLPRLDRLSLTWLPKLETLDGLRPLTGLRVLVLEDFRKTTDLAPLAALTGLQALAISGGIWEKQPLDGFDGLLGLPLRELRLAALATDPLAYRGLARIGTLTDLWLSYNLPVEVYAWLHAARPDLRCDAFVPYMKVAHMTHINGKDVMVVGHRRPWLNAAKDAKRLAKYAAEWEALVTRFRDDLR